MQRTDLKLDPSKNNDVELHLNDMLSKAGNARFALYTRAGNGILSPAFNLEARGVVNCPIRATDTRHKPIQRIARHLSSSEKSLLPPLESAESIGREDFLSKLLTHANLSEDGVLVPKFRFASFQGASIGKYSSGNQRSAFADLSIKVGLLVEDGETEVTCRLDIISEVMPLAKFHYLNAVSKRVIEVLDGERISNSNGDNSLRVTARLQGIDCSI
jgi:hypothetical protein